MISRQKFDGAEAFAAMLSQVNGDVVQYGPSNRAQQGSRWTEWSCTSAPLPHGAVMHFTSAGPIAGTGTTDAGQVVLLMPWMDRIPHFYRGVEMPARGAALYGPGAEHVGKCDADHAFTVFLFPAERVRQFLEHLLGPGSMPAEGSYLPVDLPENLRSELEEVVTELTGMTGETFPEESVGREFENRILNVIAEMLSLGQEQHLAKMPRHDARTRMVNACWDLARREPDRNLTLEDLCVAAGAGARVLQYAFEEMTGNSPASFLIKHRLHKARRMLQANPSSVKEAAYASGFTEMGRFSGYYRKLFGEKPSETLAAGKA